MRRRTRGNGSAVVQWTSIRAPRLANGRGPRRRWEAAGQLGGCWLRAAEAAVAVLFPLGSEVNGGGGVGRGGAGGGGGDAGSRREAEARPAPTARARGAQSGRSPRRRGGVWPGLPPPPPASRFAESSLPSLEVCLSVPPPSLSVCFPADTHLRLLKTNLCLVSGLCYTGLLDSLNSVSLPGR
jgi:hypothetical protein